MASVAARARRCISLVFGGSATRSKRLREIVATFRRVLGRDVRYLPISDEEWRRRALATGINQHAVEHLSQLWRTFRDRGTRREGFEVSDTIAKLGATRPKALEDFLRESPGD